jgi:hypothetical protein
MCVLCAWLMLHVKLLLIVGLVLERIRWPSAVTFRLHWQASVESCPMERRKLLLEISCLGLGAYATHRGQTVVAHVTDVWFAQF